MEPNLPPPVEEIIAEIANSDRPLLRAKLAELLNLDSPQLGLFISTLQSIDIKRQRQIVSQLVELAEDNLQLNFDGIFKYCLKDPDSEIRRLAIEGLWENEEAVLIEPLINLLENDASEKVRAAAAVAMGKFATLAEFGKLRDEQITRVRESLLTSLNNKYNPPEVRRRLLEAAAPLNLPEVKKAINDAYHSPDAIFRISAVYAMGKSCDPAWLPILMEELSNADAEVRYEAAGACGELEEEAAVPTLINLVSDSDADVQMAAIQALGKIGNMQARQYLQQCLESDNQLVRQTAEQVLSGLTTEQDPLSFRL